jgi:DNA repair exonuclease SbcCD ATPase subunit
MSTTISLSMTQTSCQCPKCGFDLPTHTSPALDAQRQIDDLQAQVRLLNQKATAAGNNHSLPSIHTPAKTLHSVDKWADYEDEIQQLRAQAQQAQPATTPQEEKRSDSPSRFSGYLPVQNRLSSFLTPRKSTQNLQQTQAQPPPSPSATELVAALTREQALRQAAEGKLDEASGELEELSAQLFQQANEMVATERKARAKLEERVEVLERRDGEKRKRLERLEGAVQRIERVRGLLAPGK